MILRYISLLFISLFIVPCFSLAANIEDMDPVQVRYINIGSAVEADGSMSIVGKIEVKIGHSNIHELRSIILTNFGTAQDGGIRNIALYDNNEIVSSLLPSLIYGEGKMFFEPFFLMKENTSVVFTIRADVISGDSETLALGLEDSSDLYVISMDNAMDDDTGSPVEISGAPTTVNIIANFMKDYDERCGGVDCAESEGYPSVTNVITSEDYDIFTVMLDSISVQPVTLHYGYTVGQKQGGGTHPIQGKSMIFMNDMKDKLDSLYDGKGEYDFWFAVCPKSDSQYGGGLNDDCGLQFPFSFHYKPLERYTDKKIGKAIYLSGSGGGDKEHKQYFSKYATLLKFVPTEDIVLQGGRVDVQDCFPECTVQMIISTEMGGHVAKSLHRDTEPFWLSYLNFEEGDIILKGGEMYQIFFSIISSEYTGMGTTNFSQQIGLGNTIVTWVSAEDGYTKDEIHSVAFSLWGKTVDDRDYGIRTLTPFTEYPSYEVLEAASKRFAEKSRTRIDQVNREKLKEYFPSVTKQNSQISGAKRQLQNWKPKQFIQTKSGRQERICSRVTRRFENRPNMLIRINRRFQKRWGFVCEW